MHEFRDSGTPHLAGFVGLKVPARDLMVGKEAQIELRELKGHWELVVQLVDDVKEL